MRSNTFSAPKIKTAEGGRAVAINAEQQLLRLLNSCFLWESGFYIDGISIATAITEQVSKCDPAFVATAAKDARHVHHLRHAPLFVTAALALHPKRLEFGNLIEDTIAAVISRVDELGEFLSLYAKLCGVEPRGEANGLKHVMTSRVKKGLARAFDKFNEYQFAKYDRDGVALKLMDVARLVHPGSADPERGVLYKKIYHGEKLAPAGTWEERLSAGEDKKAVFTELLERENLGYLALLRNLRGMLEAGVSESLIRKAILARKGAGNVLPFRYVAAARHAPLLEKELNKSLEQAIGNLPVLEGRTIVLVDTSGSMSYKLSAKSDLTRRDAAAALASIIAGDVRVFWFTTVWKELPHRLGMSGVAQICAAPHGGGTMLGRVVAYANTLPHDRLIVITDEQSCDPVPAPVAAKAYLINVSCEQNGVGYRDGWHHIDGFSEGVLRYIAQHEGYSSLAEEDASE